MRPIETTEGIMLAEYVDDLQDIIIRKCGYGVWEFVSISHKDWESILEENDEIVSEKWEQIGKISELEQKLYEAEEKIKQLEKQLNPAPVVVPIESLRKPIKTIEDLDDDECLPF